MNYSKILCLDDFQRLARRRLPRQLYSYIANGADDEQSMARNREAFGALAFTPRVLQGVAEREQGVEIFGQRYASPFGISPVGCRRCGATAATSCWRKPRRIARFPR